MSGLSRVPANRTSVRGLGLPDGVVRAIEDLQQAARTGSKLDESALAELLVKRGLAEANGPGSGSDRDPTIPVRPPVYPNPDQPDYSTPPAPDGLEAFGGYSSIYLSVSPAVGYDKRYGYIEWWRASVDDLGQAELIGTSVNLTYVDPVQTSQTFYYWARTVSRWSEEAGVQIVSPFNATDGTPASTAPDIDYLLSLLTGMDGNKPFYSVPEAIEIDGVVIPPGVYIKQAYMLDAVVKLFRAGLAVIDSANIMSLDAAKLTAGDGTIGGTLRSVNYLSNESGWILNRNGSAEFGAQHIRGLLTAAQIDTRGLVIRDVGGAPILGSGTTLSQDYFGNGFSSNLLPNSEFSGRTAAGWNAGVLTYGGAVLNGTVTTERARNGTGSTQVPEEVDALIIAQTGVGSDPKAFDVFGPIQPIIEGLRIEASAYLASTRCDTTIGVHFMNAAGAVLGSAGFLQWPARAGGGKNLGAWTRYFFFADAPTGTTAVQWVWRKGNTDAGQANSFAWVLRPHLGIAGASQTVPSDYAPGPAASVQQLGYSGALDATRNTIYRQGTAPTSPANGDIWIDTSVDPNIVRTRVSGAWQASAALGASFDLSDPAFIRGMINATNASTYLAAAVIGEAYIANGAVTNAKIGNFIRSNSYVAGVSGWNIDKSGLAEFNNVTVRGVVHATSGSFSGALASATGTFSGTLTASAIDAVNTINLAGNAVTIPAASGMAVTSGGAGASVGLGSCIAGLPIMIIASIDPVQHSASGYPSSRTMSVYVQRSGSAAELLDSRTLIVTPAFTDDNGAQPGFFAGATVQAAWTPSANGTVSVWITMSGELALPRPMSSIFAMQCKR